MFLEAKAAAYLRSLSEEASSTVQTALQSYTQDIAEFEEEGLAFSEEELRLETCSIIESLEKSLPDEDKKDHYCRNNLAKFFPQQGEFYEHDINKVSMLAGFVFSSAFLMLSMFNPQGLQRSDIITSVFFCGVGYFTGYRLYDIYKIIIDLKNEAQRSLYQGSLLERSLNYKKQLS